MEKSLLPSEPSGFLKVGRSDGPLLLSSDREGLPEEKPVEGRLEGLSEFPPGEKDLESEVRFRPGDEADESFKELKFGPQR